MATIDYTTNRLNWNRFSQFLPAIQTVGEAPEAEMGLRRRGAWKNGETLGRFRLGCSLAAVQVGPEAVTLGVLMNKSLGLPHGDCPACIVRSWWMPPTIWRSG